MSYLSAVNDKGETVVFDNQESLGGLFIAALADKIAANEAAGKNAFADIDFPEISDDAAVFDVAMRSMAQINNAGNGHALRDYLADANNNSASLLNFINAGQAVSRMHMHSSNNDTLDKQIYEGLKNRRETSDKEKYEKRFDGVPFETVIAKVAYCQRSGLSVRGDEIDYLREQMTKGAKITSKTAALLPDVLSNRDLMSSLGRDNINQMLLTADFGKLDDQEKNRLMQKATEQRIMTAQEYCDSMPTGSLAFADLAKRENVTAEEIRDNFYLKRDKKNNDSDNAELHYAMSKVCKSGEVSAAYKKCYDNLTLDGFENGLWGNSNRSEISEAYAANPERIFDAVEKGKISFNSDKDPLKSVVVDAYAANPEHLKKFGMKIPEELMSDLAKKPEITNSPDFKFLFGRRSEEFPDIKFDKTAALEEVARKGFSAGYAAEAFVGDVKKELDAGKAEIEEKKQKFAKCDEATKQLERLIAEDKALENMGALLAKVPDTEQQRLIDAAMGKEVKPLVSDVQKSSGLKRFFMGKTKRRQEDKKVAEAQERCNHINSVTAQFAQEFKDSPLLQKLSGNNTGELRNQAYEKQYAAYMGAYGEASSKRDHYISPDFMLKQLQGERDNAEKAIAPYNSLEKAYQKASAKLDYQYNLQKEARETSGTKDVEYDSGFNMLEEKEKMRAEHPEMSARELYGALRQKRELAAKAPDKPVKMDINAAQMSKIKTSSRE